MTLKEIFERLDHEVEIELIVSAGREIISDCTDWNEFRMYGDHNVLEISTDEKGTLIITVAN
jgi:hypothetical protein